MTSSLAKKSKDRKNGEIGINVFNFIDVLDIYEFCKVKYVVFIRLGS